MKSQVPIDQLLVWAFRPGHDPKHGEREANFAKLISWMETGVRVDGSKFGGPVWIDDRPDDARKIQEAVFRLCQLGVSSLDLKNECTFFLGRLATYVRDEDFRDMPAVNPGALVLQHAILGGYPKWNFGQTRLTKILGQNGQPVMLGRLVRERQYTAGSICPLQLDPSPLEIALARHDYHVWWEALRDLPKSIPTLDEYIPIHPVAPQAPWLGTQLTRYKELVY